MIGGWLRRMGKTEEWGVAGFAVGGQAGLTRVVTLQVRPSILDADEEK